MPRQKPSTMETVMKRSDTDTPVKRRRTRGSGGVYQRENGNWCAQVDMGIGGDGKRHRRTVSAHSKVELMRKLRDLNAAVDAGAPAASSTTVATWLIQWLDTIVRPRVKPKTLEAYTSIVKTQLIPQIGAYKLDKLTAGQVRTMHRTLGKRELPVSAHRGGGTRVMAPSSILKTHRILVKALTDAQREGLITQNVATLVDAPRKNESDRTALSTWQAVQLIRDSAEAHDPLATRWAAALLLGARQGELLGLTWDRVDLNIGTVDLAWQLQSLPQTHGCKVGDTCGFKRAGSCPQRKFDVQPSFEMHPLEGSLALTRPKSRSGRRMIPLPPMMTALLAEHERQTSTDVNPHNLVWTLNGRPVAPRHDHDLWKAALAHAGLPEVPLHAARHTTATLLLEAGVDAHVIASIMGHSDIVTTRGYQHIALALQRDAMGSLESLLAIEPSVT
jgi:integrase